MDERRFDYNRNVISSAPDESLLATATWSSITVRRQHDNECSDNDETSSSSSSSLTAAKRQVVLVRRRKQQLQRYKCTRFPAAIMALLTGTWLAALFAASGSCFAAAAAFTTAPTILEPEFVKEIGNITMPAGRDVKLACTVKNLGSYKVAWMLFDQSAILTVHNHVITRNPRISVSHDKHRTWYLHISNVQEEDKGRYMCQINTATAKTQYGYLHVVVPPNIDDSQSSSDVIVREGANVSLSCNASGSPTPSIRWKRDDNNKININKTLSVTEWLGNTLEISRISRLDMGNYLCIASNNVPPSVSKQIKVSVDFPPMLWIPHQLVGVPLGYSVTLECHTEAHPTSLNYWTRSDDGVMIHESRKYKVLSTPEKPSYKTNMTLTIYDVEKSDYDSYKCMAKNPRGETEGTIRLYESTPPSTSPNPVTTELASKEWDITPELNNSVYGNPSSLTIHNDKKKGGKKTPSKLNEISKHEQKFGSLDKKRNMELSSSNASALETATTASTLISLLLLIAWIIR